ncbi:MAG: tetratricopeptide repeat protein [Candidatus Eiseniibacteriota bacterium]
MRETPFPSRWAAALVALAAGYRLFLAFRTFEPPSLWLGDAEVYRRITEGLLAGRLIPDAWIWTPGYPLLGAALAFAGGPAAGLVAASVVAGVLGPVLLLRAGRRSAIAPVAALVLACEPETIRAAIRPLSESVAMFLVVATAVSSVWSARGGGVRAAIIAGAAGGLAVLARPETVLAVGPLGLLAVVAAGSRRARHAAAFALPALALVGPYVVALHSASGVWGLSLKPQINEAKIAVYREAVPYLERRARWNDLMAELQDENGEWDPRAVAAAADPAGSRPSPDFARQWMTNLREGFLRANPAFTAFVALGLLGLAASARRARLETMAAAITLLPFVTVPAFATPTGRFFLPLVPAVCWGVGALVVELLARARAPLVRRALVAGVAACALLAAARVTPREIEDGRLDGRKLELDLLLLEGRTAEALRIVDELLARDPAEPRHWVSRSEVLEAASDSPGAEQALDRAIAAGAPETKRAALWIKRGRLAEADALLRRLRPGMEDDLEYWDLAGEAAFRSGRWEDAIVAFDRAEAAGGSPAKLSFNRAMCHARLGRIAAAESELAEAAKSRDPVVMRQVAEFRDVLRRGR